MPEFIVAQFAVEEAPRLVPKLGDALADQRLVHRVITIHTGIIGAGLPAGLITCGHELITMHDIASAFPETVIRSAAENPVPVQHSGNSQGPEISGKRSHRSGGGAGHLSSVARAGPDDRRLARCPGIMPARRGARRRRTIAFALRC